MRDHDRDDVKRQLEQLGYTVHGVPEAKSEKRPDLVAIRGTTRMFVEVKTRVLDSTLRAEMESVSVGATQSILTPLGKHNALSTEVKSANDQLSAIAAAEDHRLLWFRADDDLFVHGALEQIVSTLLGLRDVEIERVGSRQRRRCAYAGYSDFFRFREIDGAIIEKGGVLTLVLNQFSPRRESFAASHICESLPRDAVVDVARAASEGSCYVVGGDVDRKDDDAVLAFLRETHPEDRVLGFASHSAGTMITVIDARSEGAPNKPLQSGRPPADR